MGNYRVQNITTVEKTKKDPFSTVDDPNPILSSTITANSHLTTFVIERSGEADEIEGAKDSGIIKPGELRQIQLDELFGTILERLKVIEDKIDKLQAHLGPLGNLSDEVTVVTA